jgi:hypothetical protein
MKVKHLWSLWQDLVLPFALCFTRPGYRRFVEWITGLVLNIEEHTITQSLIALDRPGDWKAAEWFAEYGAWDQRAVARATARLLEDAPGRLWYGYHVWAGDDTKVHRSSKHVWGTCTFHEPTARCPNRAPTVRAHNWVALGSLLHNPGQPAWYVPVAGLLYFRQSQLPGPGSNGEPPVTFRTKNVLLVELARQQARAVPGPHLLAFDGAYAVGHVVRPLVCPAGEAPRIDFLTRLRHDARLYEQPPKEQAKDKPGPKPKWGPRLPPPRQGGRWRVPWEESKAFLYGRVRKVRWKETCCLWRVLGWDVVAKVVVAAVEGYRKRFTLVTSAVGLTGLQMVELFCARFRQEDGFRDQKQRLGWEECRAWTRQPIEVTTQALFVCLTLLRLLQFRLEARGEIDWWLRPPWNPRKDRPSVLDLGRLWWRHREGIQACLSDWLGSERNATDAATGTSAM